MKGESHSLRKRLLVLLFVAIGIGALLQAVIAYQTALEETDEIFDSHMRQLAQSLSSVPLQAGARSQARGDDENMEFSVQIWSADGMPRHDSNPGMRLPAAAITGFGDLRAGGTTYRVFVTRTPVGTIQVAQAQQSRRELAVALAARFVLPILVLAPLLMAVVWWMITRSLGPLQRMREQISLRAPNDLSTLPDAGLPEEVRPVVAELNLLLARVKEAIEARQSFVDDAAHELRSPLTALRLQAHAIQRAPDNAARDVAIRRLLGGVDRAARLVEQMLSLAREEADGQRGLPHNPVDLAEVVRAAIGDEWSPARARNIDIGLRGARSVEVEGRSEGLAILVGNLLDNAVKHTPQGGRIDMTLSNKAPQLLIEDSGPGIPSEDIERVFDRFYRAADSDGPGSGLGLSIVDTIAKQHGAKVRLGRSAPLGGLSVSVWFPGHCELAKPPRHGDERG